MGNFFHLHCKSVGFIAILHDKLLNKETKMSGTVRAKTLEVLTGDSLTYPNVLHMHISTRLNFG